MFKYFVLLAIICVASCELKIRVNSQEQSDRRMLFQQHAAKIVGHLKQYDDVAKYFIAPKFGDGSYSANLAVSTFDHFIWLPYQGTANCQNTNDGDKTSSNCNSNPYTCQDPCKGGSGVFKDPANTAQNYQFSSLVSNAHPVNIQQFDVGTDTLQFRDFSVPNVPLALVKQAQNLKSLKQDGILGLGFVERPTDPNAATVLNKNLLTAMKDANLIKREQFTYYVSDTENFVTFGIQNDYLSKFDFFNYTFTNENICSNCPADASQYTNKWALDVSDFNLNQDKRLKADQVALTDVLSTDQSTLNSVGAWTGTQSASRNTKFVFDSTEHGLSFSSERYNFLKTQVFEKYPQVSNCVDSTIKDQSDPQVHFTCECGESLDNLPTFQFKLAGQIKTLSTDQDQIWYLLPTNYAQITDSKCEIFFYNRAQQSKALAKAKVSDVLKWDDHVFVGRLFLRTFFTVFDQEFKAISLSQSWYSPDPIYLDELTMALTLTLGVLSIIIVFAVINYILTPLPKPQLAQAQPQNVRYVTQSPIYGSQIVYQQSPVIGSQQQQYVQFQ